MTLDEFRRLDPDPTLATGKVLQMIHVLEQESLIKKAEGIAAWKASPVNQLYVNVGNESLKQGKAVTEILQSSADHQLSVAEFTAIADLNRQLRY